MCVVPQPLFVIFPNACRLTAETGSTGVPLCLSALPWMTDRLLAEDLLASIFRELGRIRTGRGRRYRLPMGIDRFHYEFFVDVVRTAKQFYRSFTADKDRVYATIGQYVAVYRRAVEPLPGNWWEEHLAWSVRVYKLGVSTHRFTHTFRGGWAAVEWDFYPLVDHDERLSLFVGPLGLLKETLNDRDSGIKGKTWIGEAVAGVEGQWRRGIFLPTVRLFWMPRYAKTYAHRIESEFSLPVRIGAWILESDWVSDMRVVPKLTYNYISQPIVVKPKLSRKEALAVFLSFLPWLRFKNNFTFYVQVEFRLRK